MASAASTKPLTPELDGAAAPASPPEDLLLQQKPFEDYTEDKADEMLPLTAYLGLMAIYEVIFLGVLLTSRKCKRPLSERVSWSDILLLGLATHKLSRILTRDWVAIPVRAPFTEYEGPAEMPAEVKEKPRGRGARRAVGELLTCPFCIGTWIAAFFSYGLVLFPQATRLAGSIFATTALSDFLHFFYNWAKKKG